MLFAAYCLGSAAVLRAVLTDFSRGVDFNSIAFQQILLARLLQLHGFAAIILLEV